MEHHRASRPPSQRWSLMMSKVQRDGPRGTLSVLPQLITSLVQKPWRKPATQGWPSSSWGWSAWLRFCLFHITEYWGTGRYWGRLVNGTKHLFIYCLSSLISKPIQSKTVYSILYLQTWEWCLACKGRSTGKWLQDAQSLWSNQHYKRHILWNGKSSVSLALGTYGFCRMLAFVWVHVILSP